MSSVVSLQGHQVYIQAEVKRKVLKKERWFWPSKRRFVVSKWWIFSVRCWTMFSASLMTNRNTTFPFETNLYVAKEKLNEKQVFATGVVRSVTSGVSTLAFVPILVFQLCIWSLERVRNIIDRLFSLRHVLSELFFSTNRPLLRNLVFWMVQVYIYTDVDNYSYVLLLLLLLY